MTTPTKPPVKDPTNRYFALLVVAMLIAGSGVWAARSQTSQNRAVRSAAQQFYSNLYDNQALLVCGSSQEELDRRLPDLMAKAAKFKRPVILQRGTRVQSPWSKKGYANVSFGSHTLNGSDVSVPLIKQDGKWFLCPEGPLALLPAGYVD